jgi:hypothetical protein
MTPDWAARATAVPYAVFGDPQSLNLYGYVRNDPVSIADADGHTCAGNGPGNSSVGIGCNPVAEAGLQAQKDQAAQAGQTRRNDGLGLVLDFLDIVEVSVSAGISAKASGQFGVAQYGAEATLIGGEASSGLGGGNADADVVSKAKAFGKIGEAVLSRHRSLRLGCREHRLRS